MDALSANGKTALHVAATFWVRGQAAGAPAWKAVQLRVLRALAGAGAATDDACLAQKILDVSGVGALRWLAEEVGVSVQELDTGPLYAGGRAAAARSEWEVIRARQRERFDAADAVLCAAAGGGPEAEAVAARAGGLWGLRGADRHGRSLTQAARDRHPAAAAWLAEWEGRMLLAWAMAGHQRLGAAASPRKLGDDLLRRIADLLLLATPCPG